MTKPYSKRTKRVLKHTKEQTEHARDLSKTADNLKAQRKGMDDETNKLGVKYSGLMAPSPFGDFGNTPISERIYSINAKHKPGWAEAKDKYEKSKSDANDKYGEEVRMQEAAGNAPFNMTALMQSAVREHGMPKRKKGRSDSASREKAARLQKKAK